jgi:predicted nucleic acid-binding protein
MFKIVLDTNILVSALINPHGSPAQIIDYVFQNRIRLFISPSIVAELGRVLSYPKLIKRHGLGKEKKNGVNSIFLQRCWVGASMSHESWAASLVSGILYCPSMFG